MKGIFTQRGLAARVAIIALTACGLVAGYELGCVVAIQMAENWLDQYSKLMAVQQDASSVEAHRVLGVLKNSQYPFCSDAEIAYFRELVFRSEYLKDAGRIHSGRIDCSATAGRPTGIIGQFKPGSTQQDGTIAYKNLVPIRDAHLKRAGLQLGSAYVVIGSHVPPSLGPIPINLNVTMQDAARPQPEAKPAAIPLAGHPLKQAAGKAAVAPPASHSDQQPGGKPAETAPQDGGPEATTGGTVRVGDTLYTTQCSEQHFNCVTASTSVADAIKGERVSVAGCTVAGGFLGILLGLTLSMMQRHSGTMEQQLRRAIARDKLQVAFQPIVNLSSGRIVGAESLVRWTDDEGNVVGPDVFVKIAEEQGFVGEITKFVIRRALRAFADTLRNRPGFRLSVNVAAADLADPAFLPMLDESLKRAKVPSKSLVIEITESSAANHEVAMETIRCLRRRGHSIHIDDFGTGYSNLSYLLYLSVDTIKIDKAFTRVIGTESVTVAILPQILAMAESLNLEVIVEGIETEQQESYFSTNNKRTMYGQGWLYGRPVSADEFQTLLAANWAKGPVAVEPAAAQASRVAPVPISTYRSIA
jgi:sensor c-di-GMP phosphodiesterase-like protein